MDGDDQEVDYCGDDGEYRIYCYICCKYCIERFYRNHLRSQTHNIIFRKRDHFK